MAVILGRVYLAGKSSMVCTIPRALRDEAGLVPHDVIGFRVIVVQGRRLIIGEKIPLHAIAKLDQVPVEALERRGT